MTVGDKCLIYFSEEESPSSIVSRFYARKIQFGEYKKRKEGEQMVFRFTAGSAFFPLAYIHFAAFSRAQ